MYKTTLKNISRIYFLTYFYGGKQNLILAIIPQNEIYEKYINIPYLNKFEYESRSGWIWVVLHSLYESVTIDIPKHCTFL